MTHGCRSDKWIFEGEAKAEIEEMRESWEAQFPALPGALERVLTRLIRADWRLQWTELRVFEMESQLESIAANEWTDEQHKQLQLFYRYHTSADREFHRHWNLLREYAKEPVPPEEKKPVRKPSEPEPEAEIARVYEEPTLFQTVVVKIVNGKTVTAMYPTNEEEMRVGATAGERKRAIRHFEFPDGVPEEYHWVFPEQNRRRAGAEREVEMSARRWRALVERETAKGTGHAKECPLEATRMDVIRIRLKDEGRL
jgi:hypothetical protein